MKAEEFTKLYNPQFAPLLVYLLTESDVILFAMYLLENYIFCLKVILEPEVEEKKIIKKIFGFVNLILTTADPFITSQIIKKTFQMNRNSSSWVSKEFPV